MPYKDHAKQLEYMKNYAAKDRSLIKRKKKLGSSGKYRSMRREWQINKEVDMQPVIIDFSKQTLAYNGKKFWIRFENENKLYVYSMA